jgi:nicotinamidase-related amidase
LVSDGISLGNTTVKLADAEGALAKVMPDMTKQDLQSRSEISKDLAEIELLYTREFLTGQGAVTENERKIVRNLGGTVSDSPTVLARRIELLVAKAKHNQDKVTAFQDWRNDKAKSKGLTINDWMSSPEARKLDADYDKTTDSLYNKFFGKPATTTSTGEAVPPQLKNAKEALLESLRKK